MLGSLSRDARRYDQRLVTNIDMVGYDTVGNVFRACIQIIGQSLQIRWLILIGNKEILAVVDV